MLKKKDILKKLIKEAQKAAQKAYAPYSKIQVGAALLTKNNQIFSGCNIENASYGLTICAERVAIYRAFFEKPKDTFFITCMVVLRLDGLPISPCGACRQVLAEFCPDAELIFLSENNQWESRLVKELLPQAFSIPKGENFKF